MSEFRRIMMQRQSMGELPIGYTALEYIGSNGVAYINTGVKPIPNKTRLWVDLKLNEFSVTKALFGSRASTNSGDAYNCSVFLIKSNFRIDWIGSTSNVSATANARYEFDCVNNTVTINGTKYSGTTTKSSTALSGNLLIFTMNTGTTPDERIINANIYGCKIWNEKDELIRDYLPCINDSGVYGLFDKVNKVFYGSANNYSFIGG